MEHSHLKVQQTTYWTVTLCLWMSVSSVFASDAKRNMTIRSEATVYQRQVTLKDVIVGDRRELDKASLDLDLYEFEESESFAILSREYINLRIALSTHASEFVLIGDDQVTLTYRPSAVLTDQSIEAEASATIARMMGIETSDVRVRLLQPVMSNWIGSTRPQTSFAFDFVFQDPMQLGRQSTLLRVLDGERLVGTKRIQIEVATRQPMITLRSAIRRGQRLSILDLESKSAFRTEVPEFTASDFVDRTVRRDLARGSIVRRQDLVFERRRQLQPNIIQTRDAVRLVARKNGLKVVIPQAQAMQSGRVGQIIRVKNLESNRIVTGRVVNADEVAVDLQ